MSSGQPTGSFFRRTISWPALCAFSLSKLPPLSLQACSSPPHLPNLALTAATLVWGVVSCALFRRYRNLYALGLAQGILGLCFAVCVPDVLHHHLRVGLGYLHYNAIRPAHQQVSGLRCWIVGLGCVGI